MCGLTILTISSCLALSVARSVLYTGVARIPWPVEGRS